MPWAWLHATKDYLEMAQHLERHPGVKATINLVPSLVKQLKEYLSGEATDPIVELMTKRSESLTTPEKKLMLEKFFMANREQVIKRSPRYHDLANRADINIANENRHELFSEQDYRDLAVHFSLAWTGEIERTALPLKPLVDKDRDFTEEDKALLVQTQMSHVAKVLDLHAALSNRGQVELSTTPFYHPILPLVIDSDAARESMPNVFLPPHRYSRPEDADEQIARGRKYFESELKTKSNGMWPSEGSLSNAALDLIRKNGYHWTASDEQVLTNSLKDAEVKIDGVRIDSEHAKYFPWKYQTKSGAISIFFRDHHLSDNIGFTYQSWNGGDAAADLVAQVTRIRTELVAKYGDKILRHACVSIILDGENCWEYYPNNGFEFLDTMYTLLEHEPLIQTVRFSDVPHSPALPVLESITAGSWINGNFRIWLGHAEDNAAWDALGRAREALDSYTERTTELRGAAKARSQVRIDGAYEEILIAEGSDWCWWYGDDHFSNDRATFDELFRTHIRAVYANLDLAVPEELLKPIPSLPNLLERYGGTRPPATVNEPPAIAGKMLNESWSGVPNILPIKQYGAMHKSSDVVIEELKVAEHQGAVLFRVILSHLLQKGAAFQVTFDTPKGVVLNIGRKGGKVHSPFSTIATADAKVDETIEWSIPIAAFGEGTKDLSFSIELVKSGKTLSRFPDSGSYECHIPSA